MITMNFGGVDTSPFFVVNKITIPLISKESTTNSNPATAGVEFLKTQRKEYTLKIDITLLSEVSKGLEVPEIKDLITLLLNKKNLEKLVFSNMPDRYWECVFEGASEISIDDKNLATTSIEFLVPDGISYSTSAKQYPFYLNSNGILEATIINEGTEETSISYDIHHNDENGFIGIVSENGVIQIGNSTDSDVQPSEWVVNDKEMTAEVVEKNGWKVNEYTFNKYLGQYDLVCKGAIGYTNVRGKKVAAVANYGMESNRAYYGISLGRKVSADSNGDVGADVFACRPAFGFETGKMNQTGLIYYELRDSNGKMVAYVSFRKSSLVANEAYIRCGTAEGPVGEEYKYSPNNENIFTRGMTEMMITKEKDKFNFHFGGMEKGGFIKSIVAPSLKNVKVTDTAMFLGVWLGQEANTILTFGGETFRKDFTDYLSNVPNRYSSGSNLYVDGDSTKIYINGVASAGEEIKGSSYFLAKPGETKVQLYYSAYSKKAPDAVATITEVFL
ncbi:distal tail protein Dit [Vagococcus entomophilus]|nr:distal tail protein Dit [Vagococcus entomophilus]